MSDLGYSLPTPANPLSKSAQKKQLRKEKLANIKAEKKQVKKEARKRKRDEQESATTAVGDSASSSTVNGSSVGHPQSKKVKIEPKTPFDSTLLVDLGFDDLMFDQEVASLYNQLHYSYGANKKAKHPFQRLVFTGLSGKTKTRLENTGDGTAHTRWKDVTWHERGYQDLFSLEQPRQELQEPSPSDPGEPVSQEHEFLVREKTIYLTADSENELEELEEGYCYILGGIVDRNRYKNLCLRKAEGHGVKTARLPIGKYMAELQTRKVLTVNQVVDIMLSWIEHHDWGKAFEQVIPKRKLKGSTAGNHAVGDTEDAAWESETK